MGSLSSAFDQIVGSHKAEVEKQVATLLKSIMSTTVDNTKRQYASLYKGNSPTPHRLSQPSNYASYSTSSATSAYGFVTPIAAPRPSMFGMSTYSPFAQMYESSRILNLSASNLRAGRKVFWASKSVQPSAQRFMIDELKRQASAAGLHVK